MTGLSIRTHRIFAVSATIAIACWGIAGHFDRQGKGRFDPLYEHDYTISHAPEGRTLALAGFQRGDSVVSVEGMPVEELGMYSRWPRSLSRAPGESLTLVVDREGQRISGDIILEERASASSNMLLGGVVILAAFLVAGLIALFTTESIHAVRLAYLGLALAAGFPGPYLGSWDGFAVHFQVAVHVLWTLLLFRFFLLYPKPKRVAESRLALALMYGAWLVLICTLVVELIFHPRFYHTFGPLYGLLMFVYSALAVMALAHTLVKTPAQEQRESGVRLILIGMLVALLPTLIAIIDWMFLWGIEIPGSNWFPLALGALPISMAMAVRRQAKSEWSPG